jgi:transcriptional regulator with XRE-family HTH domain
LTIRVGQRIREARIAKGMSQTNLGKLLYRRRSHAAISDLERGKTRIDVELLRDLSLWLDKDYAYFLEPYGRYPTHEEDMSEQWDYLLSQMAVEA